MENTPPENPIPPIEQLLERGDIWRGHEQRFASQTAVDTGYPEFNEELLFKGWPVSSLIEVCQQNLTHSEWLLITPALLKTSGGYIVLLNPPALPFCQALIQAGIDLERVLVVRAEKKTDFLACFFELARASACDVILAWQPRQALSYTELRKCLLASADGSGMYFLFRPATLRQQSSPSVLRILTELTATHLHITIFKQKGMLQNHNAKPIAILLPEFWQGLMAHNLFGKKLSDETPLPKTAAATEKVLRRSATITPLRKRKS